MARTRKATVYRVTADRMSDAVIGMYCPVCNRPILVGLQPAFADGFTLRDSGLLRPDIVCCTRDPYCDFSGPVQIVGWVK